VARSYASAKSQCIKFFPDFLAQKEQVLVWDRWARGDQETKGENGLYVPRHYNTNDEYDDLISRSPTPWIGLAISTLAQTMRLDGVSRKGSNDMLEVWETWQQNRWDSRQNALYRATLAHGLAFAMAVPGTIPLTGEKSAVMRGLSALTTAAWYDYPEDEWPQFAIHAEQTTFEPDNTPGYIVELIDETSIFTFHVKGDGEREEDWTAIERVDHELDVPPLVRYTNIMDLDGRTTGEVEPFIPLARRIDQDTFDRLIVQRFGAWKIRFITGLQRPKGMSDAQYEAGLLKMKINDFLVADSDKTKFGTLDETQLAGFIQARDADLRDLSAVMQIPPYQFLGLSANMQAESLAAARSALDARSKERRIGTGESHEQLFRLTAKIRGNREEMRAYDMQTRWADTEVRPLSQAADALGKLAAQVGVPLEMLWERIPGWTDGDTARAKELVESGGFDALVAELSSQLGPNTPAQGQTVKVP
jgi:hypothetical protein